MLTTTEVTFVMHSHVQPSKTRSGDSFWLNVPKQVSCSPMLTLTHPTMAVKAALLTSLNRSRFCLVRIWL